MPGLPSDVPHLPAATLPLTGAEIMYAIQSGHNRRVTVDNLKSFVNGIVVGTGVLATDTAAIQAAIDAYPEVRLVGNFTMGRISLTKSVAIVPVGYVLITLSGSGAGFWFDGTFNHFYLGPIEVIGDGNASNNHYGYGSSSYDNVVSYIHNDGATARNCVVGFDHSSARAAYLENPKIIGTVGTGTGQGYGLSFGGDSTHNCEDIWCVNPIIYNATRHSIYFGACKRGTVVNPIIYQHRNGLALDYNKAAITIDRHEAVTLVNPIWIECNGVALEFADDDQIPGGASNFSSLGGKIVRPAAGSRICNIGTGASPSADNNLSKVTIRGLDAELSTLTGTGIDDAHIHITYGADVIFQDLELVGTGYSADMQLVTLQGDTGASAYNGRVVFKGITGRVSSSAKVNFCRVDNAIAAGTRPIRIDDVNIDGLTQLATEGLLNFTAAVTNQNIRTDSAQEFSCNGATPFVGHGENFNLTQVGATDITGLVGGIDGDIRYIRAGDSNSTFKAVNFYLRAGVDLNLTSGLVIALKRMGGFWREL